jgi:hypothetical protein
MTSVYLFRLSGRGLQERYPHALIYDASKNLLGEASSHTYRGTAWAVRTPDFEGPMAFDSPAIRYLSHDPPTTPQSDLGDRGARDESVTREGCACPACDEESGAGHGAGDNDGHRFCYTCELAGCSEESVHCGDDQLCGCGGKGWEVFNEDPEAGVLGQVQRCDCEILPDEEAAYDSATAAGLLVDAEGNVLARPWGVYAAQDRRQAQVEALRRLLIRAGRLLGSCPPRIQFYALKNRVFCDKCTMQLEYAGELQDFEQWIAQGKILGFRKA